jgi:hypothetical protein
VTARGARRRPGDRNGRAPDRSKYLDDLQALADAITRDDEKLSRLSALAAKHGVRLNVRDDCHLLRRAVKHLRALVRRFH